MNIPFLDAMQQMPKRAKFLKDMLTNHMRMKCLSNGTIQQGVASVQPTTWLKKLCNNGPYYIPCKLGTLKIGQALCDTGASVSMMPLSVFKRLGKGELQETAMTLQFADQSVKKPEGILEDVLI